MSGAYAAAWLLGLLAAAPLLRTGERYGLADRIRDALIIGAAIPWVLGLTGLLYPAVCWPALALCVLGGFRRQNARPRTNDCADAGTLPPLLTIAALAVVAWPPLLRPLLDGDSVSYHLPIAAAWSHAHSAWTTDARYWWYPPGSEAFASGLFTVAGPFAVPWSGVGATALLGFRMVHWARSEFGAPHWLADALAAATIAAAPLALQAGTLQNDVWLAAFFLESLWTLRTDRSAAARTLAMTALLKPIGWIFALLAAVGGKAPRAAWMAAAAALAVWLVHDAVLWNAAMISPASTFAYGGVPSTILAHGLPGLWLLARVAARASPFVFLALLAALVGPLLTVRSQRAIGWAATAATAIFLLLPRGYADANPQLASGASLRYAAPAVALGAMLLLRPALRAQRFATGALIVSAAISAAQLLAVFWNDAPTQSAIGVAILAAAGAAMASYRAGWRWLPPTGLAVAIVASTWFSGRQPAAYYRDAMQSHGRSTGVYAWIARNAPPIVGASGLWAGTVNVLDPHARTIDLPDDASCSVAHVRGALLVAVAESGRSGGFNQRRLAAARACGKVRYDDAVAVAVLTTLR